MDKANYTSGEKYPLTTEGLELIQKQIELVGTLAQGLETPGYALVWEEPTQTSPGVCTYQGEVFELRYGSGTSSSYIRFISEPEDITANAVTYAKAVTRRYAIYDNTASTRAERLANRLAHHMYYHVPSGAIVMWSGAIADIPAGWRLCDGTNGTPDLRGRFVVGYETRSNFNTEASCHSQEKYKTIGQTGGEKNHTLTVAEMPSHRHSYTMSNNGADCKASGNGVRPYNDMYKEGTTNSTGGGQPHNNLPPYYVLAFIMKI